MKKVLLLFASLAFCCCGAHPAGSGTWSGDVTLYDVITIQNLTSFVGLADKIDLDITLRDPWFNWTVLAPSNEAFSALPGDIVNKLDTDLNLLVKVMTYHLFHNDLDLSKDNTIVPTLAGTTARVNVYPVKDKPSVSTVNGVVVSADKCQEASNGRACTVDYVLYVTPVGDVMQLINNDDFNLLNMALSKASQGVRDMFSGSDITVLAPNDFAFQHLPAGFLPTLLANTTMLDEVLSYHVAKGVYYFAYFRDAGGNSLKTMVGNSVKVTVTGQGRTASLKFDDAIVNSYDVSATNGVAYVIQDVLLPPSALRVLEEMKKEEQEEEEEEEMSFRVV